MKKHDLSPSGRFFFPILFCLFLFLGTGCSLHQSPAPLALESLPPILLKKNAGPDSFKGISVLTLPKSIPPGGSLQLAYSGTRKQGLRIAALTPMGAPFFEMAATPKSAQVREMENGKLHKLSSFTSLSRQVLGFPIALEDLMDLLSDQMPVPSWTRAYASTKNPGGIDLKTGNRLKATYIRNEENPFGKMEYFSEETSLYTIKKISDQPRVWEIEKPGQKLTLRIRSLAESPPASAELFSLE